MSFHFDTKGWVSPAFFTEIFLSSFGSWTSWDWKKRDAGSRLGSRIGYTIYDLL